MNSNRPLFSVLVANYNNSRFLKQCFASMFSQTYTNWEIVLVDDCSSDDFEEVILEYSDEPRIKVYRNPRNEGCSFTKHRCVELASGDIVAFLDPDDTIDSDALRIMTEAHLNHVQCSIIHSTLFICDSDLKVQKKADFAKPLPEGVPYLLLSDGSIHAFASFKKVCYDRTKGLDPVRRKDRAIDQELYYLLEEQGDVLFIDQPLYYYRIHAGSISNWGNEKEATIQHYQIIIESCIRRISRLKRRNTSDNRGMIRKYRTRLYKVRFLLAIRTGSFFTAVSSLLVYPFVGGAGNMISYLSKLPDEGIDRIRRTFQGTYKI